MEQFFMNYIDFKLFIIIILSGIYIVKYTKDLIKIKDVYKVFLSSVIFSVIFYFANDCKSACIIKYLITYLLATSFYEIFVKIALDKMAGFLNKQKTTKK
tara:strand:- start:1559 stop:1858 length:300 start_codon:yes stop_codon:yes gene_type:complete